PPKPKPPQPKPDPPNPSPQTPNPTPHTLTPPYPTCQTSSNSAWLSTSRSVSLLAGKRRGGRRGRGRRGWRRRWLGGSGLWMSRRG
ncbi:hypothetical protein T484DRAFT_1633707, partial [Baffinella frigidus]